MVNPFHGEVLLIVDGRTHVLRLTLGALVELEDSLQSDSLLALVERFESGGFSARDIVALLAAGLKGGGWQGEPVDLLNSEIAGGPVGAAKVAAQLLARSFSVTDQAT